MDNTQQNQGITWDNAPSNPASQNADGIIWDNDNSPNTNVPTSDEYFHADSSQSIPTQIKNVVGGTLEGMGEGVFGTLAGATDVLGGKGTKVSQFLHKEAGDNEPHGTDQEIGRGIETIGEFLMGDEALKGLALSDKLKQVSGIMKLIEKSPKLARALSLGINVGKAGAELGPEERALLAQHPILARLAGAGLDAIRQGTVQAAQTGVRSGNINPLTEEGRGNIVEAAKSGATMVGASAAVGAPLGVVGGLLEKGAQGAENATNLATAAQKGPTATEAGQKFAETAEAGVKPQVENAQANKALAEEGIRKASEDVGQLAANAPEHEAITAAAQKATQNAYKALGNEFEKGRGFLINAAKDQTLPYEDSPLFESADNLLNSAKGKGDELDEAFEKTRPGSAGANAMLEKLTDPYGEKELQDTIDKGKDKEGNLTPKAQEAQDQLDKIADKKENNPIELSMQSLLDRRKLLNERLRSTGWATDEQRADRDIYHKLIDGIDSSIESLVNQTGNPEAIEKLGQMNANYKTGITRFKNPDVRALLQGNVNDVAKRIMGGGTSVADINTVKDAIGQDAFQKLSDDSLSRMVADSTDKNTGEFSFTNFFNKWNRVSPNVRDAMFKDALGRDIIDNAIEKVQGINAAETIPNAEQMIKNGTQTLKQLMGNGDVTSLVKDPVRVQELANLVGPEAMGKLGDTILQNQLREAATTAEGKVGPVNTGQFLQFIESLKDSPEVTDSLFRPTPERAEAYNKLLQSVKNVDRVKEMVKLGILAPIMAATGTILHHEALPIILGAMATEGAGYFTFAKNFLDKIANSPQTWNALKSAAKLAKQPAVQGAGIVSKVAAGKAANAMRNRMRDIYNSTQSQLQ